VSPVKYELGLYLPEDYILHSHRHEYFKSYDREFDRRTPRGHVGGSPNGRINKMGAHETRLD
jgi:hypothetical protein